MYSRIFSGVALAIALAACGSSKDSGGANSLQEAEAQSRADAANSGQIECAIGGAAAFTRTCTVERESSNGDLVLLIRHADGGFRRFRVLTDGRGVVAADGAEPAVTQLLGPKAIEVSVGADRYRLPATVKKTVPTGAAPAQADAPTAAKP
jgi:hypothetical protein